jgi:outer membrane autotransporter protein
MASTVLAGGVVLASIAAGPVVAADGDGGAGGGPGGGAGGTAAAPNGGDFTAVNGGGGGGAGGVAGGAGGTGGNGDVGAGGTAGAAGGGNGVKGRDGTIGTGEIRTLGGGGGGGGGGAGSSGISASITNTAPLIGVGGGAGGDGGAGLGSGSGGGGGGGGAGGAGATITGAAVNSNTSTISGGNGGNGGAGGAGVAQGGDGGNGGTGGGGVVFTTSGATLTNSGTIQGGNGGIGGAAGTGGVNGTAGVAGAGGVGITGGGLTIINSGTISGGFAGGGGAQANAITFTGGVNSLTLQSGSQISGNVAAFSTADTLGLGGAANSTFNTSLIGPLAQFQGFGNFDKTGTSVWTLTGTPGTVTPWVISDGTLKAGASTNVFGSTSAITVSAPGILDLGGNNQQIGSLTGSGRVTNSGVASNATLTTGDFTSTTFSGVIQDGTSTTGLTKVGTGTFTLSGNNTYTGVTTVSDGILQAGSATGFSSGSAFVVGTGRSVATLDLNGNNSTIGSLAGNANGVVTNGIFIADGVAAAFVASGSVAAATLTAGGDNTSTTFAGIIRDGLGTLALTKAGTGTLTLTGNNTFSGATTINTGTLVNQGTISASNIFNNATFTNPGSVGQSVTNSNTGIFNNTGTVAGGLTNFGTTNANGGAINGGITNNGIFNVGGTVATNSTFANNPGATLAVGANSFTGIATLTNGGTVTFSGGTPGSPGTIGAAIVNNSGTISAPVPGVTTFSQITGPGGSPTTTLNNSGVISLQNNVAGDKLAIGGNFVGLPGSRIALEFTPQTADQVAITGAATGSTTLSVANLAPTAPFTQSAPLITVGQPTSPTAFTLGPVPAFGTTLPVLLSQPNGAGLNFSVGTIPSSAGLSGSIALTAAQTIGFITNDVAFDRISELRNSIRRRLPQDAGAPATAYAQDYAKYDPVGPYVKAKPAEVAPADTGPKPAAWIRGFGDFEQRDGQANFNFGGAAFTSNLGFRQGTGGVMAGIDAVWSGLTTANDGLILGLLGGYTNSRVELRDSPASQVFSGGSVGAYGTYLSGNWFFDALFKVDLLSLDIDIPGITQSTNLTNYNAAANIGYKFDFPNHFYFEPTAGLEYVNTNFDQATALTATTVALNDGWALRARAGARFGTEWVTNNVRIEPSLLALAYGIPEASNTALFTNGFGVSLPSDVGRLRGELQGTVNFFDLQTGWSGFARVDTRFGDGLLSVGGKAGVRYQW